MKRSVIKTRNNAIAKAILAGGVAAWMVTIFFGWVLSILIVSEKISTDYIGHCAMTQLFSAAMISALISRRLVEEKKIISGFGGCAVYAIMLNMTASVILGKMTAGYLAAYIVILFGGTIPVVLSYGNARGGKRKKIRIQSV